MRPKARLKKNLEAYWRRLADEGYMPAIIKVMSEQLKRDIEKICWFGRFREIG